MEYFVSFDNTHKCNSAKCMIVRHEITIWLHENLCWKYRYCVKEGMICLAFDSEEDAVAFKLRWI